MSLQSKAIKMPPGFSIKVLTSEDDLAVSEKSTCNETCVGLKFSGKAQNAKITTKEERIWAKKEQMGTCIDMVESASKLGSQTNL